MNTVEIKNAEPITINDEVVTIQGGNDKSITLNVPLRYEDKSLHTYIKDAKRILDKESKSLNAIGIKRLLAALIIEVCCNDNYGSDN